MYPDLSLSPVISEASSRFAISLFGKLRNNSTVKDENLFLSPFSIFLALAMTAEGSREHTAIEMQQVLHLSADAIARQEDIRSMLKKFSAETQKYSLNISNAVWVQKDYPLLQEYNETIRKFYQASSDPLDFVHAPADACAAINDWVNESTEGKINQIISEKQLTKATRLLLTNAIYFKAGWRKQFEQYLTADKDFTSLSGKVTKAKMMYLQEKFLYKETNLFQAIELPYINRDVSMLVLLPKPNHTVKDMSVENLYETFELKNFESKKVEVSFPKFKIESNVSLKEILQEMGLKEAFLAEANFSGMTGKKELFIGEVIHKTFIEVDERGTEAAAATAVTMEAGCAPRKEEMVVFHANRPFLFCIRHNSTGTLLFMGAVNEL